MSIIEGSFLPRVSVLQPEAYSATNGAFALIQSRFVVGTWVLGWLPLLTPLCRSPRAPPLLHGKTPNYSTANLSDASPVRESPDSHACNSISRSSSLAVHIEIVKPRLLKRSQRFSRLHKRQSNLHRARWLSALPQFPRHTQLQLLQRRRGRSPRRFAYQEMHMFRHDHITKEMKPHLIAHSPQLFHKNVSRAHRLQQRQPPIATKRNKMPMTFAIVAPQSRRHG